MVRGVAYLVTGLAVVLGLGSWAKNGGEEVPINIIQDLLGRKDAEQVFLNLAAPREKVLGTSAFQAMNELGEDPRFVEGTAVATLQAVIPNKILTLEQAFALLPKERGPVGNMFLEELAG